MTLSVAHTSPEVSGEKSDKIHSKNDKRPPFFGNERSFFQPAGDHSPGVLRRTDDTIQQSGLIQPKSVPGTPVIQRWDPGPLPSDDSRVPESRDEKIDRFNRWHSEESADMGWNSALPACPCSLTVTEGVIYGTNASNPDPSVWNDPTSWLWGYHEGAEWCMRSKPVTSGAGEQCCYDDSGELITSDSGSGSADKVSPDHSFSGHQREDVRPANLADDLDSGSFGTFSRRYLEVRPTNNKLSCPSNS